jgi:hypothetical protein
MLQALPDNILLELLVHTDNADLAGLEQVVPRLSELEFAWECKLEHEYPGYSNLVLKKQTYRQLCLHAQNHPSHPEDMGYSSFASGTFCLDQIAPFNF